MDRPRSPAPTLKRDNNNCPALVHIEAPARHKSAREREMNSEAGILIRVIDGYG